MNLEGLIPIFGGTYVALMAFGVISGSKDPAKMEQWRQKWGPPMKIVGPLVVVFGVAMLFGVFNGR